VLLPRFSIAWQGDFFLAFLRNNKGTSYLDIPQNHTVKKTNPRGFNVIFAYGVDWLFFCANTSS